MEINALKIEMTDYIFFPFRFILKSLKKLNIKNCRFEKSIRKTEVNSSKKIATETKI